MRVKHLTAQVMGCSIWTCNIAQAASYEESLADSAARSTTSTPSGEIIPIESGATASLGPTVLVQGVEATLGQSEGYSLSQLAILERTFFMVYASYVEPERLVPEDM